MILRAEIQGRWLGHEGEALLNGNIALIKHAPERSPAPSNHVSTQGEGMALNQEDIPAPKMIMPVPWYLTSQTPERHGTTDWFKIGKEYVKAVYCLPAYLTYI